MVKQWIVQKIERRFDAYHDEWITSIAKKEWFSLWQKFVIPGRPCYSSENHDIIDRVICEYIKEIPISKLHQGRYIKYKYGLSSRCVDVVREGKLLGKVLTNTWNVPLRNGLSFEFWFPRLNFVEPTWGDLTIVDD